MSIDFLLLLLLLWPENGGGLDGCLRLLAWDGFGLRDGLLKRFDALLLVYVCYYTYIDYVAIATIMRSTSLADLAFAL